MINRGTKRYLVAALLSIGVLGGWKPAEAITLINEADPGPPSPPFTTYNDTFGSDGSAPFGLVDVNAYRGNDRILDDEKVDAYDAWDANLGRPVRDATFGSSADPSITCPADLTIPCRIVSTITDFAEITQVTDSSGAPYTAFGTSSNERALIPLVFDPDNLIRPEGFATLLGVQEPDKMPPPPGGGLPNINLLLPGANNFVYLAFAERIVTVCDPVCHEEIGDFGTTEGMGLFVSTTSPLDVVTLRIYDQLGVEIASIARTLGVDESPLTQYFMGFTFPDDPEQHPLIASAIISFSEGSTAAVDGIVYTSLKPGIFTPVPEPSTLLLLGSGLAGLGLMRKRKMGEGRARTDEQV